MSKRLASVRADWRAFNLSPALALVVVAALIVVGSFADAALGQTGDDLPVCAQEDDYGCRFDAGDAGTAFYSTEVATARDDVSVWRFVWADGTTALDVICEATGASQGATVATLGSVVAQCPAQALTTSTGDAPQKVREARVMLAHSLARLAVAS